MQIDRRTIQNFDWLALGLVLALSIIGVLTIFSATRPAEGEHQAPYYIKQLVWLAVGLIAMVLVIKVDYQWFARLSWLLYGIGLLFLLFVLAKGRIGMGAQRWVSVGGISFQPSEIFRITFIIMIARYLSTEKTPIDIKAFLKMLPLLGLLPFGLLVKQPDLGTATTISAVFLFICLAKGMSKRLVVALIAFAVISMPFLWDIVWDGFLKDYQRNRIVAFMDPTVDPAGIGYHINQSKIAIGSGMILGKGYMHGTQGPFRFLPEKHTDFIFSSFAEEWGLLGSLVLLGIYLAFFLRALDTARKAKDEFGSLLALAITFMFAFYFFFNIGMTMGMLPVVGIPLPFMSYGGTAILSNYIAVGLLINVRLRRFELFY
ncbi:MAG: rod shape-determining protein RodA [Nitrospiraceae bacterium]|nr:rod shape-determining protein RodA [Nitrospiraceae bacterium]